MIPVSRVAFTRCGPPPPNLEEKFTSDRDLVNTSSFRSTMAEPMNKRRKIEHASTGEEDADSFASFGESSGEEDEDVGAESNGEVSDDSIDQDGATGSEDGLENGDLDDDSSEFEHGEEEGSVKDNGVQKTISGRSAVKQKPINCLAQPRSSKPGNSTYNSGTFKSNMFKLQVDDLLDQTRPQDGKRETAAEQALHKLKSVIEQIPPRGPLSIEEAERQLLMSSKVAVPFSSPEPPKVAKYKLEYERPANINVAGSYALKTASRARNVLEIDMMVMMPSSLFQDKDYLNYRYFYKRSYYLACIAAGLQNCLLKDFYVRFQTFHDDPLKPVLVVSPVQSREDTGSKSSATKWQINILPCISADVFSHDKLLPNKNCVRSSSVSTEDANAMGQDQLATPFYNSSLRSDMLMVFYLKVQHSTSKTCAAFKDACLLGSTWLRQRGLGSSMHAGGFGNFEWSALIALLLQGGGPGGKAVLSEGYSSYQLLRATLQLLAMKDLSKQLLIIGSAQAAVGLGVDMSPVVWDEPRSHNLLYKMTPWGYKLLRQEARTTLSMLSDQHFDGFEATFILRTDGLLYHYDQVIEVDNASVTAGRNQHDHTSLDTYHKLYDILQRGLGDRVSQISILQHPSETWELNFARPKCGSNKTVLVCLIVNMEAVNRTVDLGPSAGNKPEAASFRKFWGEKAELRRFKDGAILESLVWSSKESGQSVLEQVVRYLLQKHFSDDAGRNMRLVVDGFERMLPHTSGLTPFQPLMEAYKQLESDIRGLDGMPLAVRQMMPGDAQLCYATTNVPSNGKRIMPADVVLQFEGSGRWPDDLVAIQRTKIAFLLKLSDLLPESIGSLTARVGLENGEHDILNQGFLDIVYDSGAACRIRIYHDREQALLKRNLKDKTLDPQSREIAALGLAKYKRDYVKTPAHTQAIARLCSRYPAMSGTIRLTKKWFASHLLANHVADEAIEMLVARTFVQPWPWQTPSSVQTGFLRTLFWISRWYWRAEPLIVDLSGSGELKQPEIRAIRNNFEAWRKLDPALNRVVLFAASSVDPDGTTWTDGRPAKVVAGRVMTLARAACAEAGEKQLQLEPALLFGSPLDDFDIILHLNPELVGKKPRRKDAAANGVAYKNLELDLADSTSLVGYSPVTDFLQDLEDLYGSAILFFSGGQERQIIAGLWNPQTTRRAWKLNLAYSTNPIKQSDKEEAQADINKEDILAEIARLGGDMVERIEVNRH